MSSPTTYFAVVFSLCLSSLFFSTSYGVTSTEINIPQSQQLQNCSFSDNTLECEIQEMKSRVDHLELLIEMNDQELHTKSLHIGKHEKKIEELSHTILRLESVLSNLKDAPDYEEIIKVLEEQVRELEAGVRKNDVELHLLKVREKDAENSVKLLASQVETMEKVVPELWFHVQKLEQAHEVIERRTAELQRNLRNEKCSFFKVINRLPGQHYQKIVAPYTYKALNQLRRSYSAVKKHHHLLQGFVKQEMERNKYTAALAGEELIFIVVCLLVVFPGILALRWLLSLFFLASSVVVFPFILALRLWSSVPFLGFAVVVFSLMFALR